MDILNAIAGLELDVKVQLGIDVATAFSVVGAVGVYVFNSLREGRRNREANKNQFLTEKISELIEFLGDKAIISTEIYDEIIERIDGLNIDTDMLQFSAEWENPHRFPKKYSLGEPLKKLTDDVLKPIKFSLVNFPFKNYLDESSKSEISDVLEFVSGYVTVKHDDGMSILHDIMMEELIETFPIFLHTKGVVRIEDDAFPFEKEDEIMRQYEMMDANRQFEMKYAYLKDVKGRLMKHMDAVELVAVKIEKCMQVLISNLDKTFGR